MLLPNNFTKEFVKHFYDKPITIFSTEETIETDGGIRKTIAQKGEFIGNIKFNALGLEQNEIGLTVDTDIIITCAKDTEVIVNDILEYLGAKYEITEILPSDSHLTIYCKECLLK